MEQTMSSQRKLNTACFVCRKRKVRCDADNGEPCTACKRAKLECRSISIALSSLIVVLTWISDSFQLNKNSMCHPAREFSRNVRPQTT